MLLNVSITNVIHYPLFIIQSEYHLFLIIVSMYPPFDFTNHESGILKMQVAKYRLKNMIVES
mgnify:CR=1 FL=1